MSDARRGQVQRIITWSEAVATDASVQLLSGFGVAVVAAIGTRVHSSIENLTRKYDNKFTNTSRLCLGVFLNSLLRKVNMFKRAAENETLGVTACWMMK